MSIKDLSTKELISRAEGLYKKLGLEPPEFHNLDLPYVEEAEAALAAVDALAVRTRSLAGLRLKEGRTLSTANRERIARLVELLDEVSSDLKDLLASTEPYDKSKAQKLFLEFSKIRSKLLEVN